VGSVARARQAGRRFVSSHASALERCAAEALVDAAMAPRLVQQIEALQAADGSFADDGDPSIAATRRALGLLADVGVLEGPACERACAYLARVQADDGHWGEGPLEARLLHTGLLVAHLARSTCARVSMLDAAADHLAARWSPDLLAGFAWEPLAAYASCFANLPHDRGDEILQWCGRELERGFRAGPFRGLRAARLLAWCDAPALPGGRLAPSEVVAALLEAQQPDGGWPASRAPDADARVDATLDALAGLRCLARAGDLNPAARSL
jgi:hypothetical protein